MFETQGILRRRRQYPTATLHHETQQAKERERVHSDQALQKSVLRKIAHILLVLDLVSLRTLSDLGEPSDLLQYRPLIDDDPITSKLSELALTCSCEEPCETSRFRRSLETLSEAQLITRVTQLQNGGFHAKAMLLLKTFIQDTEDDCLGEYHSYVHDEPVFYDPDLRPDLSDMNTFREIEGCTSLPPFTRATVTLLLMIRKSQALYKAVVEVFEKDYFERETRSSLLLRLEQLDTYFEDAPLAYLGSIKYQEGSGSGSERRDKVASDNITATTSRSNNNHRTPFILAFLVPTICLLSCIPAALAWTHAAENGKGTTASTDYFQLLSSSILQLLGIATSLWPAIMNFRRNRTARVISGGMATLGAVFTLAAISLYTVLPVRSSALLLFAGSILQALLQLQLVLGIYDFKEHQS